MLSCHNLSLATFGKNLFKNLSFSVLPGSLIILQGPNGCGKSTLLKIFAGIIPVDKGVIKWNNIAINTDLPAFQSNLTYLATTNALRPELSVYENLKFWQELRSSEELLAPTIHYFFLDSVIDEKIIDLSSGWQRRVELAKLLLFNSNLWLLDEPEINLDTKMRNRLIDLIKTRVKEGGVVIMATHNIKDLEFGQIINISEYL